MRAVLGQARIARAGRAVSNSSADGALVHVGILPHVEPGEVEAEHVDGAPQLAQAAARQRPPSRWRRASAGARQVGDERGRGSA